MTVATPPRRRIVAGAVLVAGVAACLCVAVSDLPGEKADLPPIARDALAEALPRWHTTEVVNEIVYGTRGFDTFAETFILLGAVVGVITICRGREPRREFLGEARLGGREQSAAAPGRAASGRRGREDARRAEDVEQGQAGDGEEGAIGTPGPVSVQPMTVVVRAGARTVLPVLGVAGMYLAAWGFSPGGGFPAGAVLAGVVLLAYAANGYRSVRPVVRPLVLEGVELAGAAVIVALAAGGLIARGSFSANWLPLGVPGTIQGGGVLQAFSGAELIEVAAGLLLVVFSLVAMEREWTTEDGDGSGPSSTEP